MFPWRPIGSPWYGGDIEGDACPTACDVVAVVATTGEEPQSNNERCSHKEGG